MPLANLEKFEQAGGRFLEPIEDFEKKVAAIKTFIFDWDGVFNNGVKAGKDGSPFSELDSMGLNMLRFSYYLKFGFIPEIVLITGENNPSALHLSNREHFKAVYLNAKVKTAALSHFQTFSDVQKAGLAFMYDDILDLGLAAQVDLGFFVSREANPMLNEYVRRQKLAAYETAMTGGRNPVREVCELCISILDNFDQVVALRVANDEKYQAYLKLRNQLQTNYFKYDQGVFKQFEYS